VLIAGRMRFHWTESEQRDADVEAEEEERFCISPTLMRRLAPRDVVLSDSVLAERSAACMADATRDRFAVAALTRSRMAHTLDSARVASLRVPMLAIVGTQDANRASLEQLHAIRPDVEVRVVDGATHAGPRGILRRPETLDAIRAYLGAMAR
jgi:pimeloyl-ACP methyl ester carboxylesterase